MLRLIGTVSPVTLLALGAMVATLPVAAGGYTVGKWVGWSAGNTAGKAAIVAVVNKRNAEAAQVAKEARNDLDACFNAGGEWNQETGKCDL